MGAGLLAVKNGFILFIKNYQFPLQINTLERERERKERKSKGHVLTIRNGTPIHTEMDTGVMTGIHKKKETWKKTLLFLENTR
jgi:hypothetical protein